MRACGSPLFLFWIRSSRLSMPLMNTLTRRVVEHASTGPEQTHDRPLPDLGGLPAGLGPVAACRQLPNGLVDMAAASCTICSFDAGDRAGLSAIDPEVSSATRMLAPRRGPGVHGSGGGQLPGRLRDLGLWASAVPPHGVDRRERHLPVGGVAHGDVPLQRRADGGVGKRAFAAQLAMS